MRKFWMYLIGLLFVAGAAVAITIAAESSKDHDDKNASSSSTVTPKKPATASKKACDIFTLADAKQLLGGNVKGGENIAPVSSTDLIVSTCSYTKDTGNSQPVISLKTTIGTSLVTARQHLLTERLTRPSRWLICLSLNYSPISWKITGVWLIV
jgi:hypothetical protein